MSKTVFEHLSEQISQVVRGRRFIISEIGKLKTVVQDLQDALEKSNLSSVANTINELKSFIQNAVTTLGNLKNSISQLSSTISSLSSSVENTYNIVKGLKAGTIGRPAAPTFQPSAPQPAAPTFQPSAPQPAAPTFQPSAPQPAAPTFQPPAPQPAASSGNIAMKFDNILNAARSGTAAKDLGAMIDQLRSELSKINPLDSKLFELSMEAGRLKSLGTKILDPNGVAILEQKINKWKSQS
ncbi:MAG: hypothetical protein ACTSRZ_18430 [Promethearchaeota archaeon]